MTDSKHSGLAGQDGSSVPLRGVEMLGELLGGMLCMKLRQRYENVEEQPIEAQYTFPVPAEATLIGFRMECGDRRLEARVEEREAAFEAYSDALDAGDGGALLDQERPNVFSANVGNLLPGESTTIEVEYIQRIRANEGSLRLALPTLVAPRFIPGVPRGLRTAHGTAEPTDRVPDADRISPRIRDASYTVSLDLRLRGAVYRVESPSHRIATTANDDTTRVRFEDADVPLDRDVILDLESASDQPLTTVVAHKEDSRAGYFMVSHVPDLAAELSGLAQPAGLDVVFLLDRSGSMEGASIAEAHRALRLCLRQLREGDRFSIVAFDDEWTAFRDSLVPFTQKTLEQADAWLSSIDAAGGTELLAALLESLALAAGRGAAPEPGRRRSVVLLTDGQVGNEDEILQCVAKTEPVPIHSFGIGTNVSDALLVRLAERAHGSSEFIHPGERIDEKVVATFARAIAPEVRNLRAKWVDIEVQDVVPADLAPLLDGEPWALFGRYKHPGRGTLELRGELEGRAWFRSIPIELPAQVDRPRLPQLWAAERVRELERAEQSRPRGSEAGLKARIVELATQHGIASRYTSFVVLEKRSADRRAKSPTVARPVPVHAPAGWARFEPRRPPTVLVGASFPMRSCPSAPPKMTGPGPSTFAAHGFTERLSLGGPPAIGPRNGVSPPRPYTVSARSSGFADWTPSEPASFVAEHMPGVRYAADRGGARPSDPVFAILESQRASGLWDDADAPESDERLRQLRASAEKLAALVQLGIDAGHPQHGPLVRKAIRALAPLAEAFARQVPALAERALAIAWLAAAGPRTKRSLREAIARAGLTGLANKLDDEPSVRAMLT